MIALLIWFGFVGLAASSIYFGIADGISSYQEFFGIPIIIGVVLWMWLGCWGKPFQRLAWVAGFLAFGFIMTIFQPS